MYWIISGAFIIPYFTCLLFIGIPLFYLEIAFGQFASLGPVKIWKINLLMKGNLHRQFLSYFPDQLKVTAKRIEIYTITKDTQLHKKYIFNCRWDKISISHRFYLLFPGLGFSMIIVSWGIALYYVVIISWCLYYFFASMTSYLPWQDCDNNWNTCLCQDGTRNFSQSDPWLGTRNECCKNVYKKTAKRVT